MSKKLMVGGSALVQLGSSRNEKTVRYLVSEPDKDDLFIYQSERERWINALRHPFYNAIWDRDSTIISPFASPQSLFEIAAFMWAHNRKNGFWERQVNNAFDIKFLARKYNIDSFPIVSDHISDPEKTTIQQMIGT